MSLPIKLPGSRLYKSLQGLFFKFVHAKKNMVKVVEKIIHEKREQNRNNGIRAARDVIDVLINDATDRVTNRLTDELISDNMIDLMIPGEDSVLFLLRLQSSTLVIALLLSNMWRFLVIANGIAAGYSFIQGMRCVLSIMKGSVLFDKGLALLIFSCDQVNGVCNVSSSSGGSAICGAGEIRASQAAVDEDMRSVREVLHSTTSRL